MAHNSTTTHETTVTYRIKDRESGEYVRVKTLEYFDHDDPEPATYAFSKDVNDPIWESPSEHIVNMMVQSDNFIGQGTMKLPTYGSYNKGVGSNKRLVVVRVTREIKMTEQPLPHGRPFLMNMSRTRDVPIMLACRYSGLPDLDLNRNYSIVPYETGPECLRETVESHIGGIVYNDDATFLLPKEYVLHAVVDVPLEISEADHGDLLLVLSQPRKQK